MKGIVFHKMHGLGNDFVIINKNHLPKIVDLSKFVQHLSDRRLGIGSDQFIIYHYLGGNKIDMEIFNQDGSPALACGNATRCITKLLFHEKGLRDLEINVSGRHIFSHYLEDGNIKANMGQASFSKPWMPEKSKLWEIADSLKINCRDIICVDMGNPHLVIFSDSLTLPDFTIIGTTLEYHTLFPGGVNVNFAAIENNKIILNVWERGTSGLTYACGSGACATFAAAQNLGYIENKSEVHFKLGCLSMESENGNIWMSGPASFVFNGEFINE